jgi:thiol-disulfide isomerase/thioredoxin
MNRKFFFIPGFLLLFFWNVKAQAQKKIGSNDLMDVEVYDVNGVHTTLRQLAKNKVLFIDCWFIPCPPCFIEMGALHKVNARFASHKDLAFITICMTDSAQVKAFIRKDTIMKNYESQYEYFSGLTAFTLPVYFLPGCSSKVPLGTKVLSHADPDDKSKCPDAVFSFQGYPTSMVFNKQGKQVFKETGFGKLDEYEQRLTKALNAALADGQ